MGDDGGLLILLFFFCWCGLFFSDVVWFFFLPYFVGFQLFGLIVAQEAQINPHNPIKQVSKKFGVFGFRDNWEGTK